MDESLITVEVVYADATRQLLTSLQIKKGTTVIDAVRLSGIPEEFPELDLEKAKMGLFSKLVNKQQILEPFDRVEIYRPLLVDPKELRRRRAGRKSPN